MWFLRWWLLFDVSKLLKFFQELCQSLFSLFSLPRTLVFACDYSEIQQKCLLRLSMDIVYSFHQRRLLVVRLLALAQRRHHSFDCRLYMMLNWNKIPALMCCWELLLLLLLSI
jgi:hypothetical protein